MTAMSLPRYGRSAPARSGVAGAVCLTAMLGACGDAAAQASPRIENAVAVFAALDKVTARIQRLEVPLNETVKFGALKITPRSCYSRPPTEQPKTTTFVEVNELQLDGQENRIFAGWMFAESPGLNALEHPVFDIWLTDCAQPRNVNQPAARPGAGAAGQGRPGAAQPGTEDDFRRRRPAR